LYLAAILYLGYHGNGRHFELFQPSKAAAYYGGYSYKVDHGYQFPTSKSTWKPNFAQIGGFLHFGGHFGFKMAAIANQR
jgi:hypothetical protein